MAVIDGLEARKGTFWGLALAGTAEPKPPPSERHSLASFPCLVFGSLVFLFYSFAAPLPSHPSVEDSYIPYILAPERFAAPLSRLHDRLLTLYTGKPTPAQGGRTVGG